MNKITGALLNFSGHLNIQTLLRFSNCSKFFFVPTVCTVPLNYIKAFSFVVLPDPGFWYTPQLYLFWAPCLHSTLWNEELQQTTCLSSIFFKGEQLRVRSLPQTVSPQLVSIMQWVVNYLWRAVLSVGLVCLRSKRTKVRAALTSYVSWDLFW